MQDNSVYIVMEADSLSTESHSLWISLVCEFVAFVNISKGRLVWPVFARRTQNCQCGQLKPLIKAHGLCCAKCQTRSEDTSVASCGNLA